MAYMVGLNTEQKLYILAQHQMVKDWIWLQNMTSLEKMMLFFFHILNQVDALIKTVFGSQFLAH